MERPQPASLEDVISYTPETYFSEDEITLIRNAFNGAQGARLLKVIRKALLPTVYDPDLPIEEFGKDAFMSLIDFKSLEVAEVKPIAMGLQYMTKAIIGSLINLKDIANVKEPTKEEIADRRRKDLAK